jgi:AcrR family transcriptional regulator
MPTRRRKTRKARPRGRPPGGSDAIVSTILDAALELLGSHGYAGLRVEDVGARAGVNKTSIYRRWPQKSDLVSAALRALREHIQPEPDTGSLRGDTISMLRASRDRMASPAGAAIVRAVVAADDPGVTQIARSIWDRAYAAPSPVFERAMKRGELPPGTDTTLLLELLVAPVVHRFFILHAPTDDAFLARVVDTVLAGALVRT